MADAGRIIGGTARGLRLTAPGAGTRPFGDRVKESLFGMLESDPDQPLAGPFLDLYAGSGAAGIEALSRGAPSAVLVEHDAGAARVIGRNLERSRLVGGRVVRSRVTRFLAGDATASGGPFTCVAVDPPYADETELAATLTRLGEDPTWLTDAAVVVCKHHRRWVGPERAGRLRRDRVRTFGETALTWYRAMDAGGAARVGALVEDGASDPL